MKKFIVTILILFLLSFTACSSADKASGNENNTNNYRQDPGIKKILEYGALRVGCKVDVPRFGYLNTKTNTYEGLEIDIAYEIAAKIFNVSADQAREKGLCEFQGITAKTRGALLDNGELDIVIGTFTITEERRKSWNFSIPYYEDSVGMMCLREYEWNELSDVEHAVVGIPQGATTKEKLNEYIAENNIKIDIEYQEFDGYPSLSIALFTGNIDFFVVDRSILSGYLDESTIILPDKFGLQEYGTATALYSKELAGITDQVINKLYENGKYKELITKWELN